MNAALGQDTKTENQPPIIRITGDIGLSMGTYSVTGIDQRRDPFTYLFTGNLNFRILNKVDVPLGVMLSQQETRFLQPNNIYGISPKYKNLTGHFGYRSMNFSRYTLNNHLFLGAGADYEVPTSTGPVISVSAMYGRLRRAVSGAEAIANDGQISYRRRGWGVRLGAAERNNRSNYLSFSLFRGFDDPTSISTPLLGEITPLDNLALSIGGQYRLFKKLILNAEYGASALTPDRRAEGVRGDFDIPIIYRPFAGNFFSVRSGTDFNNALSGSATYSLGSARVGIRYERIDPNYRTLGNYFFQNDRENATLHGAWTGPKRRVSFSGSIGRQRNNLDTDRDTRTRRTIGSLVYSHALTDRINWSLNFSNYASTIRTERELLTDSLNFYQINTNLGGSVNYLIVPGATGSSIYLNGSWQRGNSRDEYRLFEKETSFVNLAVGYRTTLGNGWRFRPGITYASFQTALDRLHRWTPTLAFGRDFLEKKLQTNFSLSIAAQQRDLTPNDAIYIGRLGANYRFRERMSLAGSFAWLRRTGSDPNTVDFSEIRTRVGYRYRF